LGQNRIQFNIKFFIYAFLYLILDLEILLIFPLALSTYTNNIYGIIIAIIFIIIVTIGFIFELGKGALEINSRQSINNNKIMDLSSIIYLQNVIKKIKQGF
jgi:NADH-ubiquinone oxidoreductase chain 3